MKIESLFHGGSVRMPLVVLIHGMGMDLSVWSAPERVKILAGTYPLSSLLDERYREMRTIYPGLRELGLNILTWSQSRPAGPLGVAVAELGELLEAHRRHASAGIILIGHSRGGLIGRSFMEGHPENIRGLITIASPHRGTTLARWSSYVSPLASFARMIAGISRGDISRAVKRIAGFLQSSGLRELLPDSPLVRSFRTEKPAGVRCSSIGGTSPDLVRIGSFPLLELFLKVLPGMVVPDEMRPGLGDGLVSAASSVLPYADRHADFALNHVSLLFDGKVRENVLAEAETFLP